MVALLSGAAASAAKNGNLRRAERFVDHRCAPHSVRSADMWAPDQAYSRFNALYGDCGGGDGRLQRIWFFHGSHFVGNDARDSSGWIQGLWRNGNTIVFLYVLYRPTDPECCPTGGGKIVRYRWNG